jgi:hypothetical protein
MKYNSYTPYKGGTLIVAIASGVVLPDSIDFQFNERTVTVDFWLVQCVRQTIEFYPSDAWTDSNPDAYQKENKIQFIKAVRRIYSLGLKESKDIAEWFMDNVERSVSVRI